MTELRFTKRFPNSDPEMSYHDGHEERFFQAIRVYTPDDNAKFYKKILCELPTEIIMNAAKLKGCDSIHLTINPDDVKAGVYHSCSCLEVPLELAQPINAEEPLINAKSTSMIGLAYHLSFSMFEEPLEFRVELRDPYIGALKEAISKQLQQMKRGLDTDCEYLDNGSASDDLTSLKTLIENYKTQKEKYSVMSKDDLVKRISNAISSATEIESFVYPYTAYDAEEK